MKHLSAFAVTAFAVLVCIKPASAARQYRCGGRVQYRPCGQPVSAPRIKPSTFTLNNKSGHPSHAASRSEPRGSLGLQYAEVTKQEYQKLRDGMGLWHGAIRGNGDVHLQLVLSEPGFGDEVRYMGHIPLRGNETTFNFKSVPPRGRGWTWKVLSWTE